MRVLVVHRLAGELAQARVELPTVLPQRLEAGRALLFIEVTFWQGQANSADAISETQDRTHPERQAQLLGGTEATLAGAKIADLDIMRGAVLAIHVAEPCCQCVCQLARASRASFNSVIRLRISMMWSDSPPHGPRDGGRKDCRMKPGIRTPRHRTQRPVQWAPEPRFHS